MIFDGGLSSVLLNNLAEGAGSQHGHTDDCQASRILLDRVYRHDARMLDASECIGLVGTVRADLDHHQSVAKLFFDRCVNPGEAPSTDFLADPVAHDPLTTLGPPVFFPWDQFGGSVCQQQVYRDTLLKRIQQVWKLMTEVSCVKLFPGLAAQAVFLVGQVHGNGSVTEQEWVLLESTCCRGIALNLPVLDEPTGKSPSQLVVMTFRKSDRARFHSVAVPLANQ